MGLSEKQKLLRKIQSSGFALVEANLYLDTHPTCREGLSYFEKYKAEYEKAVEEYEAKYGPLTANNSNYNKRWEWVAEPFPWEGGEN